MSLDGTFTPRPGAAPAVPRMVLAQAAHGGAADAAQRRAAAARRGDPGDRAGRRRRRRATTSASTSSHRAGRRLHPRRAGARGDVDGVHLAGHRHRLRAPLRRDQAARLLAAAPLRACCSARSARCSLVEVLQIVGDLGGRRWLLGWDPHVDARRRSARRSRVVLGTAAFASLGLFVAGVLRAEATLAAANLVYLLLMAGGAVVLPALVVRRVRRRRPLAALRARSARRCAHAFIDGDDRLARPAGAARLGRGRHRPHREDLHVGVTDRLG